MKSHNNVGYSSDDTIKEFAEMIGRVIRYDEKIIFDAIKPDGTPRKLINSKQLN